MTSEIVIFDIPEQDVVVNKSQKQLEFEAIEFLGKIDKHHVGSFYEMDERAEKSHLPTSTLPSIMLKYIIQYCPPVILDAPDPKKYSISLQTETAIYGIRNDKYAAIPSNVQFNVVGLKIPNIFIKRYDRSVLAHYDHVSDLDLGSSGHYGLLDYQTEQYTMQRSSFTHPGLPISIVGKDTIYFTDETSTAQILSILLNYIDFIENFYNIDYPLIRYDLVPPEIIDNYNERWKVINGRLVEYGTEKPGAKPSAKQPSAKPNSKPTTSIDPHFDLSSNLMKTLNSVQNSNFGDAFYYDILYMLDYNKLTRLYNIGNAIGMEDPTFESELVKIKESMDYSNTYLKQLNAGYRTQLDIIKRKSIAMEKYGETNLLKLSKKQLDTIELEFKKLNAITMASDDNRKLFSAVDSAMQMSTDSALRSALKAVEKAIPASKLNGVDIISGGVCPHSYQYAKKVLEHFTDPTAGVLLRSYLIDTFALPGDTTGYFCKICGAKLTDPDNTSVMRFFGERSAPVEDPLQTMIWKEAMYIISNNVRFLTPMPLKPLVNSLANGLRDIVASEEAKLYRSKTNTGESIKDMLNLYSAIYIYAALCALMITNPGKLMFARDRSDEASKTSAREADKSTTKSSTKSADKSATKSEQADTSEQIESPFLETEKIDGVEAMDIGVATGLDSSDQPTDNKPASDLVKSRKSSSGRKTGGRKTDSRKIRYIRGGRVTNDSKLAEKFYLTTALKLIFLSKEPIMSRLKNMNANIVKEIFLKNAYTWAMKHAKPIQISEEHKSTHEDPIANDPFYGYTKYALTISGKHSNDIAKVLGRPEDKVLKEAVDGIEMFSTVKPPGSWKFKPSKLSNSGDPLFDKYTYDSFIAMLEYYQQSVYRKSFVPRHVQVSEYLNKYAYLLSDQKIIRRKVTIRQLRPICDLELLSDNVAKYNNFDPARIDLARHYCPSGEPHKAGSYIYTNGKTTTELKQSDIVGWLTSNDKEKLSAFANMRLINERCEKCNQTIRDAKSSVKSDKSLATMFKKSDDILAFYQYYETRCPAGNLHDIIDNICKKCGMHTDFSKKANKEFYEKYVKQFNKVQLEKQSIVIKSIESIKESNDATYEEPKPVIPEYKFSLKKTAEWSQLTGIKYNLLSNIGLFEGIKYVDLESATVNPSKESTNYAMRIMKLKGYIYSVLRNYNLLIGYENIVDIPDDIKDILDAQKRVHLDPKELPIVLPKFDNFIELDRKHSVLTPENYVNFLQEYLAGIFIDISSKTPEKYKTLASAFVKYSTKYIMTSEKALSKPTPVFAKIDITTTEDNSEDESVASADEYANHNSDESASEFAEEAETETYENEINNEGFDVEDADAVWETE